MTAFKSEVRKTCLEKVRKITDRSKRSFLMKEELSSVLEKYQHIGLFTSLDHEIDTIPLIESLLKDGKDIYLPKVEGSIIEFYKVDSLDELEISKDKYQIREPRKSEKIDPSILEIIICPGVAFSKNGDRLGHGKGYYDKYLSRCSAYKIGVCYKEQLLDDIPVTPLDIKMDHVYAY